MAVLGVAKLNERVPVREQVYQLLRRAIVAGELQPGARLIEAKLALELGISRTPIREALHRLEQAGLVSPLPTRGVVVRGVAPREIVEIDQIRIHVEPVVARLSAEAITPAGLRKLERVVQRARRYLDSDRFDAALTVDLNEEFFRILYGACPNARFGRLGLELREQMEFLDRQVSRLEMYDEPARQLSTRELADILAMIRGRRFDELEHLMVRRILRNREVILSRLTELHPPTDAPTPADAPTPGDRS